MEIVTTEMHTGGGAVRIIESGFPQLTSPTLLGKISEMLEKHEVLRKCILSEPRGHSDLYGALLVDSELEEADMGVIFIHNNGVGIMCGHAAIALARYAIDKGIVKPKDGGETVVNIHCPAGLIKVRAFSDGSAAFMSSPTFVVASGVELTLSDGRTVQVDVMYCGVFYALLNWTQLAIEMNKEPLLNLVRLGDEVKRLTGSHVKLIHPYTDSQCFISGTVLHDGVNGTDNSKNLLIFADKQINDTGSKPSIYLMQDRHV